MSFRQLVESDAKPSPVDPNKVFAPPQYDDESTKIDTCASVDLPDEVDDYSYPGRKLTETSQQIFDEYEYERFGHDPGLVVIFNQQIFDDTDYGVRHGTNRDVNELIITFGRLGYNVEKQNIFNNLKKDEILAEIDRISKEDHSHRNSLIIIVLTHGDTNNILHARDTELYTYNIWEPFSERNCVTLRDKPKFFIFQACKGKQFSQTEETQSELVPSNVYRTPMDPNMLVAFSAVEGNQSYRHINNGSWFIQELCKNFCSHGRRDDVVSLLIRTTKCVAHNYYVDPKDTFYTVADSTAKAPVQKQMPLFISTLTKKFYLTRSKDRNMMLDMLQQQQKIIGTLNKLADAQKKIDDKRRQRKWLK